MVSCFEYHVCCLTIRSQSRIDNNHVADDLSSVTYFMTHMPMFPVSGVWPQSGLTSRDAPASPAPQTDYSASQQCWLNVSIQLYNYVWLYSVFSIIYDT